MMEKQDEPSTQNLLIKIKKEMIEIKQEVYDDYEGDENAFEENEETSMEASEFCEVKTEVEVSN